VRSALVVLVLVLVALPAAAAPPKGDKPMRERERSESAHVIEGKVVRVDRATRVVEMNDGTRLKVPAHLDTPGVVAPGDVVRIEYEEQSGENVVTSVEVDPLGDVLA
jgi:hypothetical protein